MSMFKTPLQNISLLSTDITNIKNDLNAVKITVSDTVEAANIQLINEKILINEGIIRLSYEPLSSLLIHDMIMVVEDIGNDMLVHAEIVGGFSVVDKVIDFQHGFYNGYYALVSYVHRGI